MSQLGDVVNRNSTKIPYIMIPYKKLSLYSHTYMDDYIALQSCFCDLYSKTAIDRLYLQFTNKEFNLDAESAKQHVQYDQNPLHYIVTSQIKNKKLWFMFRTMIKNPRTIRHRDQVYGRYPIHYTASHIHYRYVCCGVEYDEIMFLLELGRLCYCGFKDADTVYCKSVQQYITTNPRLLTVMTRMYDKIAQKIQKIYRLKRWYRIVKEIEYLPSNGHFLGGIEFQRCRQDYIEQLCRME